MRNSITEKSAIRINQLWKDYRVTCRQSPDAFIDLLLEIHFKEDAVLVERRPFDPNSGFGPQFFVAYSSYVFHYFYDKGDDLWSCKL